jgi:hypothetical protein
MDGVRFKCELISKFISVTDVLFADARIFARRDAAEAALDAGAADDARPRELLAV